MRNKSKQCMGCRSKQYSDAYRLPESVVLSELEAAHWEPVPDWKYENSYTKIPGRCTKCGYEGPGPQLLHIRQGGQGACARCGGQEQPSTETARVVLEAAGWEPHPDWTYTRGDVPIPGCCTECGYEGPGPRFANIKNKSQGPCPVCSGGGFDPSEPAWLYCFWRESDAVWQIGITNHLERRTKDHERTGFRAETVATRYHANGDYIWQLERDLLRTLKDHNVRTCKELGFERFSGYRESWPAGEFTPPEVMWGDEAAMLNWLLSELTARDWRGLE